MKSYAVVLLCAIVLICACVSGCATTTAPDDIGNPLLNDELWFVSPGGYISADDTVGTRAIVWLREDFEQWFDPVTGQPHSATTHEARLSTHSMIPSPRPLADIRVNDSVINNVNEWKVLGRDSSGFRTHLEQGATSNTIRKAADDYLGALDSSVTFGEHIRLTNLKMGDTINASFDKDITFSGPSGNMEVLVQVYTDAESASRAIGKRFFGHKDGTVTVRLSELNGFTNADGYIEITRWDMKFLPTSNGTKVAFVAKTMQHIEVHFIRSTE